MFAQIPTPALADHRLTLIDTRVLGALFSFASISNPVCWPSRAAIAERCGYCFETISRAITRLKRFGWIIRTSYRPGSQRYVLSVTDPVTPTPDRSRHTEQTIGTDQLPPTPRGEESEGDEAQEAIPAPLSEPETAPEPQTPAMASPEAENASEARTEADSEAAATEVTEQDVINAIIAHFLSTTGTRCDQARHRKAITRALKAHTPEEIKRAASHCATTWSNRTWATPAAVCKPGRVDEVLAQAKATAAPRAAAHKLFEKEPEAPKAKPELVDRHLSALKAAIGSSR